jgi:DNA repair protein RecO (recombination protein O)
MFRSITTDAIVIRRDRMGEHHKVLALLTSDLGLITVTAFGAYTMHSRLRMASEPFTFCRAALYYNPVRRSYKVTELEVCEPFEPLHRELSKLSAVSLWAEVVMKSFGAGETSDTLFRLFLGCMRLLEASEPAREPYATVQFLWRFLSLAGYKPDASSCDRCGGRFKPDDPAFYEPTGNSFLCGNCALSSSIPLSAGALRYLEATGSLPLEQAVDVGLDRESLKSLRECQFQGIRAVLEGDLKSFRFLEIPR